MVKTKLTHTYKYYNFIQKHYITNTPPRFLFIYSKYTSPYFLIFTYCNKSTYLHGILRNSDPVRQMCIFCPLTNTFPIDDASPIITPREYVQPTEITLLKQVHNIKFNLKHYSLIQNTNLEFSILTEEVKIIRMLELLWPLLRTKNVMNMLVKLLIARDTIKINLPMEKEPS